MLAVEAFWNRPEALLDPAVRSAQSLWARLGEGEEERVVARLRAASADGSWDAAHGRLRGMPERPGGLRLVVSQPPSREEPVV